MLNIFYGRENLDKEKFIYDNIGGRGLLVVPDQFTLEAERELFAHSGAEALMDVEVISLSRLGYRLLEELGGSKRTFIDKYGRHMILSSIAAKERENLQVFKGLEEKNSFIELVNNFISEMKQFNCGAAELAEIAGSAPEGSYTQRKLEDLYLLYSKYEEAIRGKYTDSEDYIDLFIGKIGRSKLIAGNHIWIYGFDSFAPKALSVIGEMLMYAAEVNLVITYDETCEAQGMQGKPENCEARGNGATQGSRGVQGKVREKARDAELFALAGIVIRNFEKLAESRGVAVSKQAIPKKYEGERADKIRFIEQELYALPARKYGGAKAVSKAAGALSTADKPQGENGVAVAAGGENGAVENDAGSLTLVAAANLYNEAESAACYVLSLVRDFGYRFSDIKVICNDQETRGAILKRTFKEYGIDLISDTSRDILQSSIVQYITALMDVVIEKCRTDVVMKMLKSGFGDLTNEEITELENYGIKYKIRGSMWKKPFARGESEYGAEALEGINAIREKALSFMPELEAIFKAETCGKFIEEFYGFLYEKVKLPEKIADLIEIQTEQGRPDLAEETAQIWGKVIGIFDQMSEIMGGQKFRGSAFRDLFKVGISQVEIGILPPTQDGLMLGTMQRTRTGEVKALVVVGANEGVLPSEKPASGLFGSDEKNLLSEKGIEICKVDDVRFLEERMGIYRNLSKPRERLWISYSMSDAEGGPSRPSGVFTKLASLFGDTPVARDALNRDTDVELVAAGPAGLRHLTEALQTVCEGKPLASHWQLALDWYKRNQPDVLEPIRRGLAFTNKQEDLGRGMAAALYMSKTGSALDTTAAVLPQMPKTGSTLGAESAPNPQSGSASLPQIATPLAPNQSYSATPPAALSLSPSRLERYARCPFSHFVQYGLKPEERRIFEIAPREIGDIYHECLMEIAHHLTVEGVAITDPTSPWMTITREECKTFVEDALAKKTGSYREGLFEAGSEEKYRSGRIADICEKVCWAVIQQVRAGKIESCAFEASFGRGRAIRPITVDLGEGRKAYIEGKIDRVDYLPGERVKIIDYKTGNENFNVSEVKAGYRLQLMLYLEASLERRRKPAGVFYFKISEPMIDATGATIDEEEIADKIQKSFKLNGVIVDNPNVIRSVAGDFSGISDVAPIRINKEGVVSGTGSDNLLTEEEFDELRKEVGKKVTKICKSLTEGGIEIHPMKTDKTSACAFCKYKGICRFDTIFEGCKYNIVDKTSCI